MDEDPETAASDPPRTARRRRFGVGFRIRHDTTDPARTGHELRVYLARKDNATNPACWIPHARDRCEALQRCSLWLSLSTQRMTWPGQVCGRFTRNQGGAGQMIVVLMGVSGSGKTTIGLALREQTGAVFADADDYHSAANRALMAAGHPLDDADRQPWLEALNRLLLEWYRAGTDGVLACSALKESYRGTLGAGMPAGTLHFVLLDVSKETIADRLAARNHSFMNPSLLESQIQTLERSGDTYTVWNDRAPAVVAEEIVEHLGWEGAKRAEG